jgi:aspartyl/asparaginyl-tRNA synthetase
MNNLKKDNNMLEAFTNKLLEEKGLTSLDPEILVEAKKDIMEKAEDKIKATIFENIPENKLEEFNKLMEDNNEENLQKFIKETLPNIEELIAQTLLDFKNTYLG